LLKFVVSKYLEDAFRRQIYPDLVFADIMARDMNGFDCIEEYKKIGIDRK